MRLAFGVSFYSVAPDISALKISIMSFATGDHERREQREGVA
jgi:hypothetical protein